MAGEDWTLKEVQLIVRDYFSMLHAEMDMHGYSKTLHRNALRPLLNDRSDSSIESKHRNISAVLIKLELPFINGYKPLPHFQGLLEEEVIKYVQQNQIAIENDFSKFSEVVPEPALAKIDFENIITTEPVISNNDEDEKPITYKPIKINYLEREQNNRKLGEEGENLVLQYERWRLNEAGQPKLAEKVEWISKDKGDGAGYDILSKNEDGTDRYIEVKTTKLAKETPIYLTKREIRFVYDLKSDFYLYRVFNWGKKPRLFIKKGKYEDFCDLRALTFRGFFK